MTAADITARLRDAALAKVQIYPCNNVRASEIGHPCERYIVLSITNWEDRKPHGADTQNVFDLGNAIEVEAIRRIKETGLEVLTARRNFKIENPLITGREDIMLQDPETGALYPCEIKGFAPLTFDSVNSVDDMLRHRRYYVRKYPAQLQMYLFHHNKEKGFFILFNKITGRIKVIEVALDYEYTEGLLKKAERVYSHIEAKTLPAGTDDTTICEDCPLIHVCGASIDRGNTEIITGDLDDLLLRREELLPLSRELGDINKRVKQYMRHCDKAFTPNFFVQKRVVVRKPFVVAGTVYTKETILRIGEHNEAN